MSTERILISPGLSNDLPGVSKGLPDLFSLLLPSLRCSSTAALGIDRNVIPPSLSNDLPGFPEGRPNLFSLLPPSVHCPPTVVLGVDLGVIPSALSNDLPGFSAGLANLSSLLLYLPPVPSTFVLGADLCPCPTPDLIPNLAVLIHLTGIDVRLLEARRDEQRGREHVHTVDVRVSILEGYMKSVLVVDWGK